MMRFRSLAFIWLLVWGHAMATPIAIIVNKDSSLGELTRKQVMQIYIGQLLSVSNHHVPLPLDLQGTTPLKVEFYQALTGRSLKEINIDWSRQMFSGVNLPPRTLSSSKAVLNAVHTNPDAIGYVPATEATASVKVLFILNP